MFIENQSANPAVHALCVKISKRLVWIIQACLRDEERVEAVRQFYAVLREELDKPPGREEEV